MTLRAVIFDVYGTILKVGPPPADAGARWRWLWASSIGGNPRMGEAEFRAACDAVIRREHDDARRRGIAYPEVYWPEVIAEVLPEFRTLSRRTREAFEVAQARIQRTTALMPGAVPVMRLLLASGVAIGIASNAQPYTMYELNEALTAVGLGNDVFQASLTFWSFQHGFSKPDPHVFEVLTARLRGLGVRPSETLMVGDRLDNDVEPARACGWQTYRLETAGSPTASPGGDWSELARWLDGRLIS